MADLSIDPLHRSHHHPSSNPPTDSSTPSSHHPSISRVRQFSLGADSASTVTTTTSSTTSSISTTVSTVEKEGNGQEESKEEPKGDSQSTLPPPSVFELETEQEEEDQAFDSIDPQEDSSSTPRLVTPTPTPTTEKFDPLAFLTRPAGDHSYSHSYSHHRKPPIADTEPRSNGHQKVYNGQHHTERDTDTETQDRGQQTEPQPSSFLELPDPAKYAADLDAERWSLTPDGSRHDGNNNGNDNDNPNQRQEGSVYFTAAALSPKDAPSSVKSEPSFSPDRVRSLSPGYSRAKTNDPNSYSKSNSNNYSQDDLAADTANPSKEATDLFVRRLRESIWKAAGKTNSRSNNDGSLSVGGHHTGNGNGNGNGKNPSTFTQDWLAQFLTGVPRTERTNWLSDDESSSSAASEREVKGGNARKSRGVGFECLDSEGELTDTTRSYTTAVNREKTNTVEGEGEGKEDGNGEDDDWLGLEDESIAEVLELDEKEEEEEEEERDKDSRKEIEKEEAIAAADNVARDFDLDVDGDGEGEGDLSTPRAATFADATAAKATDTATATAKGAQDDDFWDLGLDDDDDDGGEQKVTEAEPSKDASENVHEKQHGNKDEEKQTHDQNDMASADVQHLHPPEQQHLSIGLSMDPKQEDLTLTQTQTMNHNHQPNSSSAELPLSPPQQPVSPRPAASKRDSSDKPLPPPPPPPKEVPPKEVRKEDGRVNGVERKQGTSPVPAHAHAQTQGLLQPTPAAAKQSPPTRSPTPAPPPANATKPASTNGNAPFARPKKRVPDPCNV
ncbi:hypothetical protein KEM55_000238, partial [Ascosphaera atra]